MSTTGSKLLYSRGQLTTTPAVPEAGLTCRRRQLEDPLQQRTAEVLEPSPLKQKTPGVVLCCSRGQPSSAVGEEKRDCPPRNTGHQWSSSLVAENKRDHLPLQQRTRGTILCCCRGQEGPLSPLAEDKRDYPPLKRRIRVTIPHCSRGKQCTSSAAARTRGTVLRCSRGQNICWIEYMRLKITLDKYFVVTSRCSRQKQLETNRLVRIYIQ